MKHKRGRLYGWEHMTAPDDNEKCIFDPKMEITNIGKKEIGFELRLGQ